MRGPRADPRRRVSAAARGGRRLHGARHEVTPRAALRTWAAATSRAAARSAPRRSHGTSRGGGDDLGSGPAARGSAAPAAMRAERSRPLRPSIGTSGPAVFRSVSWRVVWPLGKVAGVRKRAIKLLVSYKAARFAEPAGARARTPPFVAPTATAPSSTRIDCACTTYQKTST